MKMRNLFGGILLLFTTSAMLLSATSAFAGNNRYARFDPVVSQHNQSGELFRIKGHCQSSCTLFLAIRNVCIEPSATLLFHSAHDDRGNPSPARTEHMLAAYNAGLRGYVTSHHYMDTLEFHSISGGDMIRKFGYRACPKT
jgi:hypothetical protein